VSRYGLMGMVEKVRFGELYPLVVFMLSSDVRFFVLLWVCGLCLCRASAIGPLLHSVMIDSSSHAGCQCTS